MAFLQVNGVDIPTPKRGVSIVVSTAVDAGRNVNGEVVGQPVGRDLYKIDGLEWPWLTAAQWRTLLSAISSFFFNVTFTDPVTNSRRTIEMYCGDRSAEPYWLDSSGSPTHYLNCKVNFVDTGR